MGYTPALNNAKQLHVLLGYVNISCALSGTSLSLNPADGFTLSAADAGAIIMVFGAGTGGAPLWATISGTPGSSNTATLSNAAVTNVTGVQAVIYREVAQTANGNVPTLLEGSWKFRSSLTTRASASFNIFSIDGAFVPNRGQPVLVIHDVFGDVFGGVIQQTKATLVPGRVAVISECQCVSWDILLTRRLLRLAQANAGTFTDSFIGDGSSKTFHLSQLPLGSFSGNVYTTYGLQTASWAAGVAALTFAGSYPTVGQHVLLFGVQIIPGTGPGWNGGPFVITSTGPAGGGNTNAYFAVAVNPGAYTGGGQAAIVETAVAQTFSSTVGSGADWYWSPTNSDLTQETVLTPLSITESLWVTYQFLTQLNYYNASAGDIVQALGALVENDGVTVTAVAGPNVISIAFTVQDTVDAALAQVCQYSSDGTNNYWYWMDARRGLHFDQLGVTSAAPWNVAVPGDILVQVSNTVTLEKYGNAALVEIANALGSENVYQGIVGDGTKRTFNTTYPIGQLLSLFRNLVPQKYSVSGDPSVAPGTGQAQWYWSPGSTAITEDSSQGTLGSSEFLAVTYLPLVSGQQTYNNTAAQAARKAIEGGTGEYDIHANPSETAPTLDGTTTWAQLVATYYAIEAESVAVVTFHGGHASGQGITVDVPGVAGPGSYVVDSVQMTSKGNILMWSETLIAGAALGDWRTAFRQQVGAGTSLAAIGGGAGTGAATTVGTLASVSFTEVGPRYSDGNGSVRSLFSIQPVASSALPFNVTVWIDKDDGLGPIWQGWNNFTVAGQSFLPFGQSGPYLESYVPTNSGQENWVCHAAPGLLDSSVDPTTLAGHVTATLTVAAVTDPTTTDVIDAFFVPDDNGHTLLYSVNSIGVQDFWYNAIQWTQPTGDPPPATQGAGNDVNYFCSMIMKQRGFAQAGSGTVSGLNTLTAAAIDPTVTKAGFDIHIDGVLTTILTVSAGSLTFTPQTGIGNGTNAFEIWNEDPGLEGINQYPGLYKGWQVSDSGELSGANGPTGSAVQLRGEGSAAWGLPMPTDPVTNLPNPYLQFRFRIYAVSRTVENLLGGNFILQTCWSSNTADHADITPSNLSNPLDLRQTNLQSALPTQGFNASGQFGPLGIPVLASLPSLPSAYYPVGAIVQLNTTGKFYQNVAGAFQSTQDPSKMIAAALAAGVTISATEVTAGTFIAGVLYANAIACSQLTAGGTISSVHITATDLVLNENGITTSLSNLSDSTAGTYVGLQVKDNLNGYAGWLTSVSMGIYNPNLSGAIAYLNLDGSGHPQLIINSTGTSLHNTILGNSALQINNKQVVTIQQTGPGTPSFSALSDAQTWCASLNTALKAHGLIT